jgi:hypothetical protein
VTVIAAGFPKGVSEEFLSSDGKKTYLASQTPPPLPADRDRRKPASRKEDKHVAAEENPAPMPAPPEEQFLFPEESTRTRPVAPEPDEDLGIPAFLRNRMKKKNK